jgi:hypothetical protein
MRQLGLNTFMTISLIQKIIPPLAKFCAVFCAWLFLVLVVSAVPGFTQKVDVYFPPEGLLKSLPENVSIVAISSKRITFASPRNDLALSLYRVGALFLITSENSGCLDLQVKPRS